MPSNDYNLVYPVDIVMVIDVTGSMRPLLDTVKQHALSFYDDLHKKMQEKGKPVGEVRVRLVAFRDYLADKENAMKTTPFFSLPGESAKFESVVKGLQAKGGGDDPEDGLEALAYAMKSDWTKTEGKCRQIIVVWTDTSTHPLGFGAAAPNYPKKMPRDFDALTEMWGDRYQSGLMDQNNKRLVIYAPLEEYWSTISSTWDLVAHYPAAAGKGLEDVDYDQILDMIAYSV